MRAVKMRAARTGRGDSQVIEESPRRDMGLDLLERLWEKTPSRARRRSACRRGAAQDAPQPALRSAGRARPQRRHLRRAVAAGRTSRPSLVRGRDTRVLAACAPRHARRSLSARLAHAATSRRAGLPAADFMRMRGLEPPPGFPDTDLNRARLPIPPHPRAGRGAKISHPRTTGEVAASPAAFQAPRRPSRRRHFASLGSA
jgi:hypothetical protein